MFSHKYSFKILRLENNFEESNKEMKIKINKVII